MTTQTQRVYPDSPEMLETYDTAAIVGGVQAHTIEGLMMGEI
jgi:hypothetical protein